MLCLGELLDLALSEMGRGAQIFNLTMQARYLSLEIRQPRRVDGTPIDECDDNRVPVTIAVNAKTDPMTITPSLMSHPVEEARRHLCRLD